MTLDFKDVVPLIVGLRGAGKSNFLRCLLHDDARQHFLESDSVDFAFILIDLVALPQLVEWAVWE